MDGTRIDRIEIDRDENGALDRWEYYTDNQLAKVGSSSRGDGVVDEWAFHDGDGLLARVESDTNRDGTVDKWELFARAENGRSPILQAVMLDPDQDGRPTKRLVYASDGQLLGIEALSGASSTKE
jgi:hypothetical protein